MNFLLKAQNYPHLAQLYLDNISSNLPRTHNPLTYLPLYYRMSAHLETRSVLV